MRSPKRIGRGIRASFELTWPVRYGDEDRVAAVREIPAPSYCVVDERTGVLRAIWERVP